MLPPKVHKNSELSIALPDRLINAVSVAARCRGRVCRMLGAAPIASGL
jgi:hypothetical protein